MIDYKHIAVIHCDRCGMPLAAGKTVDEAMNKAKSKKEVVDTYHGTIYCGDYCMEVHDERVRELTKEWDFGDIL